MAPKAPKRRENVSPSELFPFGVHRCIRWFFIIFAYAPGKMSHPIRLAFFPPIVYDAKE